MNKCPRSKKRPRLGPELRLALVDAANGRAAWKSPQGTRLILVHVLREPGDVQHGSRSMDFDIVQDQAVAIALDPKPPCDLRHPSGHRLPLLLVNGAHGSHIPRSGGTGIAHGPCLTGSRRMDEIALDSTNLMNVSVYMADAWAMQLLLVSLGGGDEVIHDWNWLFTKLGLLRQCETLGRYFSCGHVLGPISFVQCVFGNWLTRSSHSGIPPVHNHYTEFLMPIPF